MSDRIKKLEPENERLHSIECDYTHIRRVLGCERMDNLITMAKEEEAVAKEHEIAERKQRSSRDYAR
jgi:hypothetical protein